MTKQYEVLKPVKDSVTGDMKSVGSILRIAEDAKDRLAVAEKLVKNGTLRLIEEKAADESAKKEPKGKKATKKDSQDKKSE